MYHLHFYKYGYNYLYSSYVQGGVQLFAVVADFDLSDTLPVVDRSIIDQNVKVGENFSTPTNHSWQFNFGHFVLSFRVMCTENFYGSDCATLCMDRDDDLGQYTCDSEGNIVCRERFQDPSTNCTECREGYTGDNCATGKNCSGLSLSVMHVWLWIVFTAFVRPWPLWAYHSMWEWCNM